MAIPQIPETMPAQMGQILIEVKFHGNGQFEARCGQTNLPEGWETAMDVLVAILGQVRKEQRAQALREQAGQIEIIQNFSPSPHH